MLYLDDNFIQGKSVENHNLRVKQVLECLKISGIHLKREKCKFALRNIAIEYKSRGYPPEFYKMKAIHEAPTAKGKTELQAFSGMLEFYGVFLKYRSDVLE